MSNLLKSLIPTLALLISISCNNENPTHLTASSKTEIYREFIDSLFRRGQFNGNALVSENGEIVFQASKGLGSIHGDSLSLQSQFRLASVSKQFTCMAIMTLKEDGKLEYDDPIQNYIPEWPYEGTIRHLMNHTSGSPSYEILFEENWKPELDADNPQRTIQGNEHMVAFIAEHQPEPYFEAGEHYRYSNTAYVLLATIVARVSGTEFNEYMRRNVFLPAGMEDTYVFNPLKPDPLEKRVYGFSKSLDGLSLVENDYHFLNPVAGDGGVYSTLKDLFAWNQALYTDKVISQVELAEAFQPAFLNNGDTSWYGFGWNLFPNEEWGQRVTHSGGWVGFRTRIERMLGAKNCIIVLTNNSNIYTPNIVDGLRSIMRNGFYDIPKISAVEIVAATLLNEGEKVAISKFHELYKDSINYEISESQFNSLGYRLLREDKKKEAIACFTLNTEAFPQSANVWDSLGDAFLALQDSSSALKSYEKAMLIDPQFDSAREKASKLKLK